MIGDTWEGIGCFSNPGEGKKKKKGKLWIAVEGEGFFKVESDMYYAANFNRESWMKSGQTGGHAQAGR